MPIVKPVAKPLVFRKNLKYTYRAIKSPVNPPINSEQIHNSKYLINGKRRSRIDKHILSKDPQLEIAFLLDGKNEMLFDVSKEGTREPGSVTVDYKKVVNTRYVDYKGKKILRDGKSLAIHTHSGKNMTEVLPSFGDVKGTYVNLILDHLNKSPYRKNSLFSDYNMIVGYDTANKRISGRTIYKISEDMKNNWLRKFSLSSVIKDSVMIKEKNGKYSSVSLSEFQKQLETHYDSLTKKMADKIIDKIERYRSKNKDAIHYELYALYAQEYFHYLQRYFGIEIHFQAEPGYKLNHETFHFEKV